MSQSSIKKLQSDLDEKSRNRVTTDIPNVKELENAAVVFVRRNQKLYINVDGQLVEVGGMGTITKTINETINRNQTTINNNGTTDTNTQLITINNQIDLNGTGYLTLGNNYGAIFDSIKTVIGFTKINAVLVYLMITDDTVTDRILENLTLTSGVSPAGVANKNVLEYAIKFDTDKKLILRITEKDNSMTWISEKIYTGNTAINNTLYTEYAASAALLATISITLNVS